MSVKAVYKTAEEFLEAIAKRTGRTQVERADDMGVDAFHVSSRNDIGTPENENFLLGSHFGTTAKAAETRYNQLVNYGAVDEATPATTYPLKIDVKNPYEIDDHGMQHSVKDIANQLRGDEIIDDDTWWEIVNDSVIGWDGKEDLAASQPAWEKVRDILAEEGFDGISYTSVNDDYGSEILMPLYKDQVRGRFALHDPANASSPNLMASLAGATTAGILATASQKSEAGEPLSAEEFSALAEQGAELPTMAGAEAAPLSAYDTVRGAIQQYTRGATFGSADEIVAGVRTAIDGLIDKAAGLDEEYFKSIGVETKEKSFGETFNMLVNEERLNRQQFLDENPISGTLLEIAGGLATGGFSTKVAKALMPAAGAALSGAATGFIDAAIYGGLDADTDAAGRFKEALMWGAGGAAGGAVLGKAGKMWADKKSARAAQVTERYKDNLTIAVHQGLDGEAAVEAALIRTRISPDELDAALRVNNASLPKIPTKEAADRAAPEIMAAQREMQHSPAGWLDRAKDKMAYVARKSSDRLARIAPKLSNEMRRMEMNLHTRTQDYLHGVKAWEKAFRRLNKGQQTIVARALFNDDVGSAMKVLDADGRKALQQARGVLRQVHRDLLDVGYDIPTRPDYYPRQVKDYDGLQAQRGKAVATEGEQFIAQAKDQEKAYADWVMKADKGSANLPNTKQRTIDTVSTEMMPFYGDAVESLSSYIHRAAGDIEMKRFFNRSAAGGNLRKLITSRAEDFSDDAVDALDNSLDLLIKNLGIVGSEHERTVKDIIRGRFTTGRRSMSSPVKFVKDTGTAAALGHVSSTITQLGDLANAIFFNGGWDTFRAMGRALVDKGQLSLKDVGLDNRLTQDLQTAEGLTKWVDGILSVTGFKFMDRFGKRTLIGGALNKARRQLASPKGEAAFRKQWQDTFGDATDELIGALKRGDYQNENVKLMAFNTVSDAQPVSLMEMPQAYLDSPNGRIFYTMKSYAVNQLNIALNALHNPRVSQQTRAQAYGQLGKFLLYTGVINGTVMEARNMVRGDEFKVEDIPDNVVDSLLSLAFLNRYNIDHFYGRGDIAGGIANAISPPVYNPANPAQFPVVGQMVDDWLLGNKEKRREKRAEEKGEFYLNTSLDLDLDLDL